MATSFTFTTGPVSAISEPRYAVLLSIGLLGLVSCARKCTR
jgi:hypothetical protein